jgi:hypothetical protein
VTGPTITGTIASPQPADLALNVAFGATDDNGVISVTLYARHTDDAWTAIPLTFSSGQWRGTKSPPSSARPASNTPSKSRAGACPRVEMYSMAGDIKGEAAGGETTPKRKGDPITGSPLVFAE